MVTKIRSGRVLWLVMGLLGPTPKYALMVPSAIYYPFRNLLSLEGSHLGSWYSRRNWGGGGYYA